jgi:tetratricopeptide (TPR) repeat protein
VAKGRRELQISQSLYERYFAIVQDPPLPVLRNYALLLHSQGDYQGALDTLTIALNRAPADDFQNQLTLLEYRQNLRKETGDEAGAAKDAAEYREVAALYRAWRGDEAKRRWRELLESAQESDLSAVLTEANNAAAAREFGTARKLYERYFEMADNAYPFAILGYATVLMGLEEYTSALEALTTVNRETLGKDPSLHSNFLRTRALIKERMGDTDGSRADWLERKELLKNIKAEKTENIAEGE